MATPVYTDPMIDIDGNVIERPATALHDQQDVKHELYALPNGDVYAAKLMSVWDDNDCIGTIIHSVCGPLSEADLIAIGYESERRGDSAYRGVMLPALATALEYDVDDAAWLTTEWPNLNLMAQQI